MGSGAGSNPVVAKFLFESYFFLYWKRLMIGGDEHANFIYMLRNYIFYANSVRTL